MARTRYRSSARQGSVYLAVTGTAILVSLIGFTSMHLSRLELRVATSQNESAAARRLAQSSVEFSLGRIAIDNYWRSNYTHGDEETVSPSAIEESLVFRFLDNADGDLADDATEPVEIQGIGRCGNSTAIYSVEYSPSVMTDQQVAVVVGSYEGGHVTQENVGASQYLGHYFVASLPAEAVTWSVTSVDLFLMGHGAVSATLDVKLYHADGSGQPGTLIEGIAVDESQLPAGSFDWYSVDFGSANDLAPGAGFCLALECYTGGNAATVPYDTGVSQTNSHLLRGGNGAWYSQSNTQSIQYRVNGVYTTSTASGEFTIAPGSWRLIEAP